MCHVVNMMDSQYMRMMKYIFARHSPFCNNLQYLKGYSNDIASHPDEFVKFEITYVYEDDTMYHIVSMYPMYPHIILSLIS